MAPCPDRDISKWTTANHLKLKIDKTKFLFMPGKHFPQMELLVAIENINITAVVE